MQEKRALIEEEAKAQILLQHKYNNKLEDVTCLHLAARKILLNLEAIATNDKMIDAFEHYY